MNQLESKSRGPDPAALDRLVDGELPDTQRRELLTSLEQQPDGWRQCALAFLEAQSWGEALEKRAHAEADCRCARGRGCGAGRSANSRRSATRGQASGGAVELLEIAAGDGRQFLGHVRPRHGFAADVERFGQRDGSDRRSAIAA